MVQPAGHTYLQVVLLPQFGADDAVLGLYRQGMVSAARYSLRTCKLRYLLRAEASHPLSKELCGMKTTYTTLNVFYL
jgi:hypothetical protein